MSDDKVEEQGKFERWLGEIQESQRDEAYKAWRLRCAKIAKRYRAVYS